MKVLIYRWKVFNQEDIQDAWQQLGHEVTMYESHSFKAEVPEDERQKNLHEMKEIFGAYDLIFSVNYFSEVSDVCEKLGKKYVSWTVDSPMISMYHDSVFNGCNYIFLFDQFQYMQFAGMGLKHVYYLPLAVNANRVQMQLQQKSLQEQTGCAIGQKQPEERFSSEIAFVGGLYQKNSYDAIEPALTPYLRGYFDAAMEAQMDLYGDNIFDSLLNVDILTQLSSMIDFQKDERSFSDLKLVFTNTYLGYKLAEKERIRYLNELAKSHQVNLYSDETDPALANVIDRGTVDYLADMPKVFCDSKINLNLTIRNIRTGIPLRIWDILGAGGFALTNFQVELNAYFENGIHLVYFDGIEDCKRKADYYLTHDEERESVAKNGLELVKREHSYVNRLEKIIACISN